MSNSRIYSRMAARIVTLENYDGVPFSKILTLLADVSTIVK